MSASKFKSDFEIPKAALPIKSAIYSFFDYALLEQIEIYNEFSLQHELGVFLRTQFPNYQVQFERNISHFGVKNTIKKEIDIVLYRKNSTEDNSYKYAIELKFTSDKKRLTNMYHFVKDVKFMEQLKQNGFTHTYCIALVQNKNYYQGNDKEGIYKHFRDEFCFYGEINHKNSTRLKPIQLDGSYPFNWEVCEVFNSGKTSQFRMYCIEI